MRRLLALALLATAVLSAAAFKEEDWKASRAHHACQNASKGVPEHMPRLQFAVPQAAGAGGGTHPPRAPAASCRTRPPAWPTAQLPGIPSAPLQKCKDSGFCTRLRGVNATDAFAVRPETVAAAGAAVTATVVNKNDANGTFFLTLTAYKDVVRLHINEAPSKGRYQVPDVLLPGVEAGKQVRQGWKRSWLAGQECWLAGTWGENVAVVAGWLAGRWSVEQGLEDVMVRK